MIFTQYFIHVNLTTKAVFELRDLDKTYPLATCECQEWEKQGGWLMWVHVHPDHRRQTLGLQLLAKVLEAAGAAGKTGLGLAVRKDNEAAIGLYEQMGFTVCYESGQDVVMTVHLGAARRRRLGGHLSNGGEVSND